MTQKIYDARNDPLFGKPVCVFDKSQFCFSECEYGLAYFVCARVKDAEGRNYAAIVADAAREQRKVK